MKEKFSKLSSLALIALLTISALMVFAPKAAADPTNLEIIDPVDGDHNFIFDSSTMNVGDTFDINITVVDVDQLQNLQVKVTWDPSLLDYVSIDKPSDFVFADSGYSMIVGGPTVGSGEVTYGYTYINNNPYHWCFNGTGTIAVLTLEVIQGVSQGGPTEVHCDIELADIGSETFLINCPGVDITFTPVDGFYSYSWVAPSYYPTIYIKPSVEKPDKIGDIFGLEIWIRDVHQGWEIIGFQFSLMWNTTFIEPATPYFDNGTFLEAFQYYADGVLYTADINTHDRPLPLTPIPVGYNYSMFGALLLPDNPPADPYHPTFPSVGSGGAKLMTVYFKAIYETVSPIEDWTWIEFIDFKVDEDTFAINKYITVIKMYNENCYYRAPMKVLGLSIDLFTQYTSPYGGQGAHQPSDMFGPQQQVELFALVTYNEYPVQQKLVGFHITHDGYDIYREDATDADGLAHVSFRLPWPCVDPVSEIFGKWLVIATVEVAEQVKNDTLGFWVWWKVFVITNEPKQTEYEQRKTGGDPLTFTVTYSTYSMQELDVTLTETVYDELGFFIGSAYLETTVGWGEYKYYDYLACEPAPLMPPYVWDITIPLPTNAVVGKGTAFANAFDAFPWLGGVPYCPEVINTIDFYITKP